MEQGNFYTLFSPNLYTLWGNLQCLRGDLDPIVAVGSIKFT